MFHSSSGISSGNTSPVRSSELTSSSAIEKNRKRPPSSIKNHSALGSAPKPVDSAQKAFSLDTPKVLQKEALSMEGIEKELDMSVLIHSFDTEKMMKEMREAFRLGMWLDHPELMAKLEPELSEKEKRKIEAYRILYR